MVHCVVYPTAIGSEPQDNGLNSSGHWRRTMQGHSAVSVVEEWKDWIEKNGRERKERECNRM